MKTNSDPDRQWNRTPPEGIVIHAPAGNIGPDADGGNSGGWPNKEITCCVGRSQEKETPIVKKWWALRAPDADNVGIRLTRFTLCRY